MPRKVLPKWHWRLVWERSVEPQSAKKSVTQMTLAGRPSFCSNTLILSETIRKNDSCCIEWTHSSGGCSYVCSPLFVLRSFMDLIRKSQEVSKRRWIGVTCHQPLWTNLNKSRTGRKPIFMSVLSLCSRMQLNLVGHGKLKLNYQYASINRSVIVDPNWWLDAHIRVTNVRKN